MWQTSKSGISFIFNINIYFNEIDKWITYKFIYVSKIKLKTKKKYIFLYLFRPSSDLSSNTSIHSQRSNIDLQLRQTDLSSI